MERAAPLVTVYSGLGKIDVSDAAPEVIAALPGMTPDRVNAFLAQRRATSDEHVLLPLLGPAQAYASTEPTKTARVRVQIVFKDGFQTSSEVVIVTFEQGNEPYSILSWRDHLDEPPAGRGSRMASR